MEKKTRYTLLVTTSTFVGQVNAWIKFVYNGLKVIEKLPKDAVEEHFSDQMWAMLKLQWSKDPSMDDAGLLDQLPKHLVEPPLKIVVKYATQHFKLDNGEHVPMFNYGGKMTVASGIPQILICVAHQAVITHDETGHAKSAMSDIVKNIGDVSKN